MSIDSYTYDETLIIFDWDDTILPSSWLAKNNLYIDLDIIPNEYLSQLSSLQKSISLLLERAITCGNLIIITNSDAGWIEVSCKKFLPEIVPLLSKIKILSARSTFQSKELDSPIDWKIKAFYKEINLAYEGKNNSRKNILSWGDSQFERTALHKGVQDLKFVNTKSIKFIEKPTIEQLHREIDLVYNNFFDICNKLDSLDLMITIEILY
jgi:hypothetical protein